METAQFFKRDFEENGSMERVTLFLNLVWHTFVSVGSLWHPHLLHINLCHISCLLCIIC